MAALIADEDVAITAMQNALPIPVLMPEDIAGAVAFLEKPVRGPAFLDAVRSALATG